MCGIVYIKTNGTPAAPKVWSRYLLQKTRGQQGYGFIALKDGVMMAYERAETEAEIYKLLKDRQESEIIFHHRFPTSTPNYAEVAHPIHITAPILKYDYYFVHNGMVHNDDEMKKEHESLGIRYSTICEEVMMVGRKKKQVVKSCFNDSEALGIDLALAIENNQASLTSESSAAFIILQVEKNAKKAVGLFFGRNLMPLIWHKTEDTFSLASESGVEAGKFVGDNIPANILQGFLYAEGKTIEKPLKILSYQVGYQTPRTTIHTVPTYDSLDTMFEEYDDLCEDLKKANRLLAQAREAGDEKIIEACLDEIDDLRVRVLEIEHMGFAVA